MNLDSGIYQSCPTGCELSGREWVKFIWHLISLHGCWLSDRVSNAGRQGPGMKVAAGGCPEQHSSIQYSRSCSMLLRVSSWISKPPTDAPYKLIFFQPINIIQMSCPNIFIKAEMKTFSSYPIESEESHSLLSFQFFISQHRMVQKYVPQAKERQETPLLVLVRCCKELPGTNSSPQWWKGESLEFMIHSSIFVVKNNLLSYLFNKIMWLL